MRATSSQIYISTLVLAHESQRQVAIGKHANREGYPFSLLATGLAQTRNDRLLAPKIRTYALRQILHH